MRFAGLAAVRGARCAAAGTVIAASLAIGSGTAGAASAPTAGFSIIGRSGPLTIEFIGDSNEFPSPVTSYMWSFGDGQSKTTTTRTVVHTYTSESTFNPSVTASDGKGDMASASGVIEFSRCPAGSGQCTESLHDIGTIQLLQATGPISPTKPAFVNLFAGPFQITNCNEKAIGPSVALDDGGFIGNLAVTLEYASSQPSQANVTCFSSKVKFLDSQNKFVDNGPLPTCQGGSPTPPCVQSVRVSGNTVSKVVLIPPGDPKVGAP